MMTAPSSIASDATTHYDISQIFLDWVDANRKKATEESNKCLVIFPAEELKGEDEPRVIPPSRSCERNS
jgi:hypothetical protein